MLLLRGLELLAPRRILSTHLLRVLRSVVALLHLCMCVLQVLRDGEGDGVGGCGATVAPGLRPSCATEAENHARLPLQALQRVRGPGVEHM